MQMLNTVIAMHLENGEKPCRLLLLDEHTSALDHKKARTIMDYTHREALRSRCTVLMVTHRYEEAFRFANRIIVLHEGKVLRDLNKADLNSSDDIRNIVDEA